MKEIQYCTKCGAAIKKGDKFCGKCGNKLHQKAQSQSNKNKKGGCLKRIFKALGVLITVLFLIGLALYFIGDSTEKKNKNKTKPQEKITEKDMLLPPFTPIDAQPKLSDTKKFTIKPKKNYQSFEYKKKTQLIIPPSFMPKSQELSVSTASVNKAIWIENQRPLQIMDVSLKGKKQPSKPIEITFSYNKSDLDPNKTVEEQLGVYRWDENGGAWVSLPTHIATDKHQISAMTDHFSIIGLFVKIYVGSAVGEKLLNDTYITPKKNFLIMYSKKSIENHQNLNDMAWKSQFTQSAFSYKTKYPRYIQDIGSFLEISLTRYESAGMINPTKEVKGYLGTYKEKITVKLDSYLSQLSGDPFYEKLYERLHIPTYSCLSESGAKITLAHELFHRLQAEYYGVLGMRRNANLWFLESTAEYAAYNIAWPSYAKEMYQGCGNNYLVYPVNGLGNKKVSGSGWTDREYEYVTSIWIKYLQGLNIPIISMIKYDAADLYYPRYSITKFLYKRTKKSMATYYRAFTHYMLFSKNSPLKKYPLVTAGYSNKDIATKKTSFSISDDKEITSRFLLPNIYSSQVWAIQVQSDQSKKRTSKVLIEIEKKETTGQIIDVFTLKNNQRFLKSIKPKKTFYTEDGEKLIEVNNGDWIYIVIINGEYSGGLTKIKIKDASPLLTISPSKIPDAVPNKPYLFKINAENIPKTVKKVNFEWTFGGEIDGIVGVQDGVSVSGGEAELKLQHKYKPSTKEEKYPFKVVLKDASTGMVLATAEAPITLPYKPSVFITERHITGAPGATFELIAEASPEGKYQFIWEISRLGKRYKSTGKKSIISPIIQKTGKYYATVKLYDLNNKLLDKDKVSIIVEKGKGTVSSISLSIRGKVALLNYDNGKLTDKSKYSLENLTKSSWNNDGSYQINGTNYYSTIGVYSKKIIGNFSTGFENQKEKQEITLLLDKSKNLKGFQFKKNMDMGDQYGVNKSNATISFNNIPFKKEKGQRTDGKHYTHYRFSGNILPYLQKCEYENVIKNNSGSYISKFGKPESKWEIFISVAY